jgi:3-methyladenine DNA glycosylase Tag
MTASTWTAWRHAEQDIERLLSDPGIIRNRLKVLAPPSTTPG